MIDLHTHSNASDGSFSPAELIALAAERGLSVLALTDHDTIGGLKDAARAAKRLNIGFIPGIELEITMPGAVSSGEFHLLGLGINKTTAAFTNAVAALSKGREERNREILDLMKTRGFNVSREELVSLSGGHSVGRPHFASLLVKKGIVKTVAEAFDKYLGKGKPLYAPKTGLDFDLAVSVLKETGALAILAHPMSLYLGWGRLPAFLQSLREKGLDGLEAWHPTAKVNECKRLEELARSLCLAVTAGSDFHGGARPDRKLGITAGERKIEDSLLDALPLART